MSEWAIDKLNWDDGPANPLFDAVEAASEQDRITWLTVKGQRVAAIVPVCVVGEATEAAGGLMSNPAAGDPETYERALARQANRKPVVRQTGRPVMTMIAEALDRAEEQEARR